MFRYTVKENTFEKHYEIPTLKGTVRLKCIQRAGEVDCKFEIEMQSVEKSTVLVRYGETTSMNAALVLSEDGTGVTPSLKARGTEYYFCIECNEKSIMDVICVRAIHRYPYGRTFLENKESMTQHFGQEPVIGYDLEYFTTSESLDPQMRALETTDPVCYINHILHTILREDMPLMEQCKALWLFLGQALQHNAMLLNLKESGAAQQGFADDYTADNDAVVAAILEQGFTRCGFVNGFVSAAFLKRMQVENRAVFACGGHTMGQVYVNGTWRFWDVDGFKIKVPVDDAGDIPAYDWVVKPENIYLLDTVPSWEDTPTEEGWLTAHDGHRVTGYVDGCRSHAVTGFTSTWFGAPKSFPPSVPQPLAVSRRKGDKVILEWIGSYDRSNNFRDYLVRIISEKKQEIATYTTEKTGIEVSLPENPGYSFTVEARSWHAKNTKYFEEIYYTKSFSMKIPQKNICVSNGFDLIRTCDNRKNLVTKESSIVFRCIEGFDNVLGQTRFAKTDLFKLEIGKEQRVAYKMVDETNYLFSGCRIRSLFSCPLEKMRTQSDGWHFTAVMHISAYDFAGLFRFPALWVGRKESHVGVGIGLDCKKGLLHTASNLMGDWRYGAAFEPKGCFRFDVYCRKNEKILDYYLDGRWIYTEDYNRFDESVLDVDTIFVSGNPDAETGYMILDLLI